MANMKYIYALICDDFSDPNCLDDGPGETVFYIGKSKNPEKRYLEHKANSKYGTEDKYVFIREIEAKNWSWWFEILLEIEEADKRPWEYWYVLEYIRKGAPLKNMRFGDFRDISESKLRKLASDENIKTIDCLVEQLKNENLPRYESSKNNQLKAILKVMRFLRTERKTKDKSNWVNVYDLGEGTNEIRAEYYMKKEEVAKLYTPDRRKNFERLDSLMKKIQNKPFVE